MVQRTRLHPTVCSHFLSEHFPASLFFVFLIKETSIRTGVATEKPRPSSSTSSLRRLSIGGVLLREIRTREPRATYVVNRRKLREKRYPVEGARWKPRTSTVMSSARLLVVRRAFLVLDARWTMAKKEKKKKTLSSRSLPHRPSICHCSRLYSFHNPSVVF